VELRLVVAALRRRALVVAAAALLGLLLAGVLLALKTGPYEATASLLLDPLAVTTPLQEPSSGDPERFVDGQLRVLASGELAGQVAQKLPGTDAASVRGAVVLAHVTGSDIVDVTARADSAAGARDTANTLVNTYVEQRRSQARSALKAQQDDLDKRVTAVQKQLATLGRPADAGEQQVVLAQYQDLLEQRRTLLAPGATSDKTAVVDPAEEGVRTRLPGPATLLGGLVLGALAGLALAIAREGRSPHVSGRPDVERVLGLPAVAVFPRGPRGRRGSQRVSDSVAPAASALASVVAVLPALGKRRLVGVCSARPGAGSPNVAMGMAVSFSRQGLEVVVVRAGRASRGEDHAYGRDEAGRLRLQPSSFDGVSVLWLEGSQGVPWHEEVRSAVPELPAGSDVVVVDLPPVLVDPVAVVLASWWDDLVLVVPVPDERQQDLELVREMLAGKSDLRLHPVVNMDAPGAAAAAAEADGTR